MRRIPKPALAATLMITFVAGLEWRAQPAALAQTGAKLVVEWPCRERSGQKQDEYCEWNTSTTPEGGLRCTYTSTFDGGRAQFLTQANRFNSKAFLVALIEQCTTEPICKTPNCVPARQADPAVCRAVANIVSEGCKADVDTSATFTPTDSREKLTLVVGPGSESVFCKFVADPSTGADDRTLVRCDVPKSSAYKTCEQLSESVFVRAVLVKRECR